MLSFIGKRDVQGVHRDGPDRLPVGSFVLLTSWGVAEELGLLRNHGNMVVCCISCGELDEALKTVRIIADQCHIISLTNAGHMDAPTPVVSGHGSTITYIHINTKGGVLGGLEFNIVGKFV
jgi:hypothetical protein